MTALTLPIVFTAGFVIMTPVGPVSTLCIRRSLIYGPRAGIAAGAGNAVALATYATLGINGSTLLPRFFAAYTNIWHVAVAGLLAIAAILIWRSQPPLEASRGANQNVIAGGFGSTLAMALANPADIVLFAALFTALGVAVNSTFEQALFCATIFAGGCAYWITVAFFLNRWRSALTIKRMTWLNRASSLLMIVGAVASLVSVVRDHV